MANSGGGRIFFLVLIQIIGDLGPAEGRLVQIIEGFSAGGVKIFDPRELSMSDKFAYRKKKNPPTPPGGGFRHDEFWWGRKICGSSFKLSGILGRPKAGSFKFSTIFPPEAENFLTPEN